MSTFVELPPDQYNKAAFCAFDALLPVSRSTMREP
jgi:hypothetical protein